MANRDMKGPGGGSTRLWASRKGAARSGGGTRRHHHQQREGQGYPGGRCTGLEGRKRHTVVDTLGTLLAVVVHAANIQSLPRATTRGPGWGPVTVGTVESRGQVQRKPNLGRWSLLGSAGGLGSGIAGRPAGGSATSCPEQGVPGVAPEVDSGAHPGLVKPLPETEQEPAPVETGDFERLVESFGRMVHIASIQTLLGRLVSPS